MIQPGANDLRPTVVFDEAVPSDDPELRRLLRDNPMPGAFRLALTREPSFFHAAALEGDVHQTVVARTAEGRLLGLGSRAVRDAFVNGEATRLGYLAQLRVDREHRGTRGLLRGGFAALQRLHDRAGEPSFYVTTLIAGNELARRALARPRPGLPTYTEHEPIHTLALPLWRRQRSTACPGVEVRVAAASDLDALAECLQRNLRRYQFAPVWTAAALADPERCRGLSPGDFRVATRGGRVVGCVALWDQTAFKQTVVHGYSGALRLARPLVNVLAPWLRVPRLPPVGGRLHHAFLSHLAVDDDDPLVASALLAPVLDQALVRGFAYVVLSLARRHPLLGPVRRAFRALVYASVLYTVHWGDGADAVARLDGRVPHLDVAVL